MDLLIYVMVFIVSSILVGIFIYQIQNLKRDISNNLKIMVEFMNKTTQDNQYRDKITNDNIKILEENIDKLSEQISTLNI